MGRGRNGMGMDEGYRNIRVARSLVDYFELGDLRIGIHHSSFHWVFARKKGQRRPAEPHPKLSDALPACAATPRVGVAHLPKGLLTGELTVWVVAGPLGAV